MSEYSYFSTSKFNIIYLRLWPAGTFKLPGIELGVLATNWLINLLLDMEVNMGNAQTTEN